MFAVPGWNLDAGSIKAQAPSQQSGKKSNGDHCKSKKRKRGKDDGKSDTEDLSKLWEKHVKHPDNGEKHARSSKKSKRGPKKEFGGDLEISGASNAVINDQVHGHRSILPKAISGKEGEAQHGDEWDGLGEDIGQRANVPFIDKDAIKVKFEKRKASSLQKKEQKAHLRASGEMPPSRSAPKPSIHSMVEEKRSKKPNSRSVSLDMNPNIAVNAQIESPKSKVSGKIAPNRSTAAKDLDALLHNGSRRPKPSTMPKPPALSPSPSPSRSSSPPSTSLLTIPPAPPKLTSLQQKMRQKLISARFRHLNQTLYTSPSSHSANLFASSPEIFASYHAGFEAQVAVWPQNPVDLFVRDILQRGKAKGQGLKGNQSYQGRGGMRGKKGQRPGLIHQPSGKLDPLPRTVGTCHIVDLGCGNASLSASLQPHLSSLNLDVQSFDLAKPEGHNAKLVTLADITSLPPKTVKDGSVDLVICCLSLMPTNWPKIVDTTARILRVGAEAWVAEVRSRFARKKRRHGGKADDHLFPSTCTKGGKKEDEEEAIDDDRMVDEVEDAIVPSNPGPTTKRDKKAMGILMSKDGEETDLTPFIEVWKRRGMEVREMDQGNKMFVGVKFVKRRAISKDEEKGKGGTTETEETNVLKPCVYKLR